MGDQGRLQSKLNCLVQFQGTIKNTHLSTCSQHTEVSEASLDERLKSFRDLETLGIRNIECSVYDHFIESIRFRNGRYYVRLLWKDPHCMLPDNYDLSQKRLYGLLNRLRHNTGHYKRPDCQGDCGSCQEPI